MKHIFQIPQALEIRNDVISFAEVFPEAIVPELCKSGRDICFSIPVSISEMVNKGDVLVKVIFYETDPSQNYHESPIGEYSINSEYTGVIYHDFHEYSIYTIDELSKPILIYPTLEEFVEEQYPRSLTKYEISTDPFTGKLSICWEKVIGVGLQHIIPGYHLSIRLSIELAVDNDLPVMRIIYKKSEFSIRKQDDISFKFIDGIILHFPILKSPTKLHTNNAFSVVSLPLQQRDIIKFTEVGWDMMRIEHTNGEYPQIINHDFNNIGDRIISQLLFKQYASVYEEALDSIGIKPNNAKPIPSSDQNSVLNPDDVCYVYLMVDTSNGYYKIGISNKPEYREKTLQSEKPSIERICSKQYPSRIIAQSIESALHNAFASKRIRGEWFDLSEIEVAQLIATLK